MEKSIQQTILTNLIHNEKFTRQVIPFLKKKYFEGNQKYIFDLIINFVTRYNKLPTLEALEIELNTFVVDMNLSEPQYDELVRIIASMKEYEEPEQQWLSEATEKWVQDRSLFLAIMESINIIDGKNKKLSRTAIPDILSEALSVSFDTNIGHDYENDTENRYEFYHEDLERIPFDLDILNKITKGGLPNKTLNVFMADTGVGKSLMMCHMAANNILQGKNVLYVTMEMSEERIGERIDANILDITMDQLHELPKDMFMTKVGKLLRGCSAGQLIIKEYPTGVPHVGNFRALLSELKLKKNFVPNIIYVDYINICSSSRIKFGGGINTYSFIKSIGEELRGLAIECDVPVVSVTQGNRGSHNNSDIDMSNVSESYGLPGIVDLFAALIVTEDLEKQGQIMVRILKNRYNSLDYYRRFLIGVDKSKMKLYDLEDSAQQGLTDSGNNASTPGMTSFPTREIKKRDFSGMKV